MQMKYQENFVKRKTRIIKFGIMTGLLIMAVAACERQDGNAVNMPEKIQPLLLNIYGRKKTTAV